MYVSNILRLTIFATWATYVTVNSLPAPDLTISIWATVITCKTIPDASSLARHYMQLGQLGIWQV